MGDFKCTHENARYLGSLMLHLRLLGRISRSDDPTVTLGTVTSSGALEPEGIIKRHGITPRIRIQIDPTRQPDGILGEQAPGCDPRYRCLSRSCCRFLL